VVTEASAKQKTLELESEPGGVLRELALARWRGLPGRSLDGDVNENDD
jgi:hypothetical protein